MSNCGLLGLEDKSLALKMLENMLLSRKFEEKVQHYFSLGMIHGTTHLSIGEEAAAAGALAALYPEDQMFATHRGHSQAVCKGIDLNQMMAEIFAKETGVCKGKGGSMHIADVSKGVMGANGILGPSLAIACGVAFSHKRKKDGIVTAVFFGDGATNEGAFHESLNLASVWELPVLFLCINNTYGMSTHISKVMKNTNLAKRAEPFEIPAITVNGNNVEEVYFAVKKARLMMEENPGPIFIVENTYRISGHSKSDGNLYRTKEEINEWKKKCPIKFWKNTLVDRGICNEVELNELELTTTKKIEEAVQFALDSPFPSVKDIYADVYAK